MSWLSDRFVQLTDANPRPKANGRTLCLHKDHIVAVYRQEDDPTKTNVFTSDGNSYTVQESVQEVYKAIN